MRTSAGCGPPARSRASSGRAPWCRTISPSTRCQVGDAETGRPWPVTNAARTLREPAASCVSRRQVQSRRALRRSPAAGLRLFVQRWGSRSAAYGNSSTRSARSWALRPNRCRCRSRRRVPSARVRGRGCGPLLRDVCCSCSNAVAIDSSGRAVISFDGALLLERISEKSDCLTKAAHCTGLTSDR